MSQNTKVATYKYIINGNKINTVMDAPEVFSNVTNMIYASGRFMYVEKVNTTTQHHKTLSGGVKSVEQPAAKPKIYLVTDTNFHGFAEFLGIDYQRG